MSDLVHNFVDNGGVRLCLERRGSGPRNVLFAHGWISSRRMWYDVTQRLDPARYTMHLLDFRGCGLSDRPTGTYDLEGWASDLRAALAHIPGPVTLVAHSLGGRIAQYVATERPVSLERMILVAARSSAGARRNDKQLQLASQAYGSRTRIEAFQRAAQGRPVPAETMERVIDDALVCHREAWFDWFERDITQSFEDRVGRINVPVLAIAGAKDPLAPPSRIKSEISEAIPGCVFLALREAGHNLPVEVPDEIAGAIERFVV